MAGTIKINVKRFSFSEIQSGKASADTEGSRLKRIIRDFLDAGHNVETSKAMFEALQSGVIPISGISVIVALVAGNDLQKKKGYSGISKISDVIFDYVNKELRVWQYSGIGEGEVIKIENYKHLILNAQLEVSECTKHSPTSSNYLFWRPCGTIEKNDDVVPENNEHDTPEIDPEDEAPEHHQDAIFYCPLNGCQRSYTCMGYLQRHLLVGNHLFVPERCSIQDYAINAFAKKIENAASELPKIYENLEDMSQIEEANVTEGWAIRKNASRTIYTTDQKNFLNELFVASEKSKKRIDPTVVQKKMIEAKDSDGKNRFKYSERLSSSQIARYYAPRLNKLRDGCDDNNFEESDSDDLDDLLMKEPMFSDEFENLFENVKDWSELIPKGKETGEFEETVEEENDDDSDSDEAEEDTEENSRPVHNQQHSKTTLTRSSQTSRKRNDADNENTNSKRKKRQ